MTARAATPDNGARDIAIVAFIVATLTVAVVLLAAAHATSLILHRHPAHLSASTLGHILPSSTADPGDWGTESGVSSAVLFWTITAVLALGCAVGARKWWVWWQPRRERERFRTLPGMGSRARVLRETGRRATMRSGKYTRPGTVITRPEDAGYAVGRLGGHRLYASVEDAGTVFGPPRCGKGVSIVIPLILDAPGSVLATATRPETVAVTMLHRQRENPDSPVAIFDPQGLTGLAPGLRWSITRGCQNPHTALVRGAALAAGSNAGKGTSDESHWRDITADLASALLQAAAIKGKGANDLYRWSISPNNAKEAVRILTEHQGAQSEWGVYLKSFLDGDPRIRDSAFSGLRQAFRPLSNPAVRELVTPKSEAETLDPASFMKNRGTLFILGTASGSGPASSLISALISDFVETGRTVATRLPGGRLNPPHLNVLDEIVQLCRLPDLGGLMADGGGSGITTFVVAQSPSQIETSWSASEKNTILDASNWRFVFGGLTNRHDLEDIVALGAGRRIRQVSTNHRNWFFAESTRTDHTVVPVLDVSILQSIPKGQALGIIKNTGVHAVDLADWRTRPDARRLERDRQQVYDLINGAGGDDSGRDNPDAEPATIDVSEQRDHAPTT